MQQHACNRTRDAAQVQEPEQPLTPKTTRITVETETLIVIRRAKTVSAWCPGCRAEVDVVALKNDSLAEPALAAQIREWLDRHKLHVCGIADGPAQICLTSLFRCFELEAAERFFRSQEISLDQSRRKQK
jgi:hypothetical protein